jgi:hypothetical protein
LGRPYSGDRDLTSSGPNAGRDYIQLKKSRQMSCRPRFHGSGECRREYIELFQPFRLREKLSSTLVAVTTLSCGAECPAGTTYLVNMTKSRQKSCRHRFPDPANAGGSTCGNAGAPLPFSVSRGRREDSRQPLSPVTTLSCGAECSAGTTYLLNMTKVSAEVLVGPAVLQ